MIVIVISIASLLSGALGSYDSLAKCLYEEEVADAQVGLLLSDFPLAGIHDFVSRTPFGTKPTVMWMGLMQ